MSVKAHEDRLRRTFSLFEGIIGNNWSWGIIFVFYFAGCDML